MIFWGPDNVDIAGHSSGFTSDFEKYVGQIEKIDSHIKRVLEAIESRTTYNDEEWLVVITSDHGGDESVEGHGSLIETHRKIPLIIKGDGLK